MKLLGIALLAVLLAGCAVVPVPGPPVVYGPSVSVGVGPVYPYHYGYYPYYRPYPYRHWN